MAEARRPCAPPPRGCGLKRAERFFTGPKGRVCTDCQKQKRKASSHGNRVEATYGITSAEYDAIFEAQGGVCAICKGKRPYKLNVDHDHEKERQGLPPRECVRGLLCRRCNGDLLPAAKDNPATLLLAAAYLTNPPAHAVLFPPLEEAA